MILNSSQVRVATRLVSLMGFYPTNYKIYHRLSVSLKRLYPGRKIGVGRMDGG